MFKNIKKALRWFFEQPEDDSAKITRTRKYELKGSNSAVNASMPIKVKGLPTEDRLVPNPDVIIRTYNQMVEMNSDSADDTIEIAKTRLFMPLDFTDKHIDHVLMCCGYQKTHKWEGKDSYDPRLIQAVRLGINMYSSSVHERMKSIEAKLAGLEKESDI